MLFRKVPPSTALEGLTGEGPLLQTGTLPHSWRQFEVPCKG